MLTWIAIAVVVTAIASAVILLLLEHEFAAPLIVIVCIGLGLGYGATILLRWLGLRQLLFTEMVQLIALSIAAAIVCLGALTIIVLRRRKRE